MDLKTRIYNSLVDSTYRRKFFDPEEDYINIKIDSHAHILQHSIYIPRPRFILKLKGNVIEFYPDKPYHEISISVYNNYSFICSIDLDSLIDDNTIENGKKNCETLNAGKTYIIIYI